jgi:hypothetical protein
MQGAKNLKLIYIYIYIYIYVYINIYTYIFMYTLRPSNQTFHISFIQKLTYSAPLMRNFKTIPILVTVCTF